jgi:hypothetical protein
MPDYDADGDVTQIGLTTIKVQNWDKQGAELGQDDHVDHVLCDHSR